MKRAARIIIIFSILLPFLFVMWLTVTESGLHWVYQRAKAYLPAGINIASIEGRLIGPITLKDVAYQHENTRVKFKEVVVNWHPVALLGAKIEIHRLHIQSLQIALPETADAGTPQNTVLPDLSLPWRMSLDDVVINDIQINQGKQNVQLQQISLSASTLLNRIHIQQLSIRADNWMVELAGEFKPAASYPHDLTLGWQLTLPSGAVMNGTGSLSGNLRQTQLKQQLTGPLQLTLQAELNDLLEQLNWQAEVDVSAFDTAQLGTDWPAMNGQLTLQGKGDLVTATVTGKLNGYYAQTGSFDSAFQLARQDDNRIRIDQLILRIPGNNTQLAVQGNWMPGDNGGDISLALNWQNLRWPMQGTPWFDSARGSGGIEGTLDHYQIKLTTESPWPQVAPSMWSATAQGDLNGLTFQDLRIKALDGEAVVTGRLNWSPALSWQAQARAGDINPSGRWPAWPGKLNVSLSSTGHMEKDQLVADAHISQLQGVLRGYPVKLHSRLIWRDNRINIPQFEFSSGTSLISAQGQVGETLNLDWRIEAGNLAELYPELAGRLNASGQISGQQAAPVIKASINGKDLSLPGYRIGSVEGVVAVDLLHWQQIDIRLAAQKLELNGYSLQALDITADTQQIQANIFSETAQAHIALRGEVNATGWHGHIERADILSSQFDNWKLEAPAALAVSENALLLEALCWHNSQQASLCGTVQRDQQLWKSSIQLNQLPLLLFSPWLPPDLKLEGVVDARAELQLLAPDQLHGSVRITLPPGTVGYPLLEGERDRWEYRGGMVDISLAEQGLKATSEIAMSNGDMFHFDAWLPGAELLALNHSQQNVYAQAELSIRDLGLVEALIPELQDLKGEVAMTLNVAGTLARPRFSGKAELLNGAVRIPQLGLSINQLKLQAVSDGFETIRYTLGATSDEGSLAIQGQTLLDSAAGWLTEFGIRGDRFEVSRIPEARVLVSPDLQVKIQNRSLSITGSVDIPFARLQPKDLTTAARVSDDVVIVGGEKTDELKWVITSKVRLTLGERVNFSGFGFDGRLGGSLLLEEEPGQLTRATGEINIPEGRYRAYGQRLDVERGYLLYAGGPITNPGLDLRAVRKVYAVTAGVKVKGSLAEPQLELFSDPAMPQTDILSYLVLGRPMESASGEESDMVAKAALAIGLSGGDRMSGLLGDRLGLDEMRVESSEDGDQASLVVGRYLSPDIYVSYGVGLVEAINTFTVRYQLSDQWYIKAESGEFQGADIFYTIDR